MFRKHHLSYSFPDVLKRPYISLHVPIDLRDAVDQSKTHDLLCFGTMESERHLDILVKMNPTRSPDLLKAYRTLGKHQALDLVMTN